ncbi:MAG TPA: cation:proton antiporter [Phycisphaerae bacterium]|nr:cation:proton antiporter [Phycisphaerae bacterium]
MTPGQTIGLLALMLLAALAGTAGSARLRLPNIIGLMVAGLALRWGLAGMAAAGVGGAEAMAAAGAGGDEALEAVKLLALAAVMFSIGMAFESHHLRRVRRDVLQAGTGQAVGSGLLTVGACLLVGWLFGADRPIVSALFLGAIATVISPAATLLTLRQYQAKGRTTEDLLAITGLSVVLAIVLFDAVLLALVEGGAVGPETARAGALMAAFKFVRATGGSILLGVLAGLALSALHGRATANQEIIAVLGVLLGALALREPLSVDVLLVPLAAGATFINTAVDPGRLEQRLNVVEAPLFLLLFVVAGFELDLGAFARGATVALVAAYVLARSVGKIGGTYLGVRMTGRRGDVRASLGLGMLCHAEVKIGLMAGLTALWSAGEAPRWVGQVSAVVIGSVAVFEIAGPLLLRHTIVTAGEVKAFRLFHLPSGPAGGVARMGEAIASLLRRLGLVSLPEAHRGPLLARHVMTTSVKLLPAGAGLDEVLHFIEHSRLDHFPVTDAQGRLVGTISLADVSDMIYQPELRDLVTAQDLLEDELVTASPDETLAELFDKFRRHKARDLVILDADRNVLGIVEQRDVLRAMHVEETGRTPLKGH